ncbi:MAG: hypothetical protein JWQ94_4750 [Tardiphaga sp.]|jgi:hypothetical protein|nr:hypothetical protein [Tardiphaga sp.]
MQALFTLHDYSPDQAFAETMTPTTALFADLLTAACQNGDPMRQAVPVACVKRLIASRAWTDAALALVALRLPDWQLRRLAYDDGEWHCALSRSPEMPEWLDATVEAHHPNMPLAILSAFVAASAEVARPLAPASVLRAQDAEFEPMLCDNFA